MWGEEKFFALNAFTISESDFYVQLKFFKTVFYYKIIRKYVTISQRLFHTQEKQFSGIIRVSMHLTNQSVENTQKYFELDILLALAIT